MLKKLEIVSGGQTGVDRAALDTAMRYDLPCGGWCPSGRVAEDGPLSSHYPLTELAAGGYPARTRKNVADADATLVIHGPVRGRGTELTIRECRQQGKPLLILDLSATNGNTDFSPWQREIRDFLQVHDIGVLNVAGPRASGWPMGYTLSRKLLARVFATA